MLKLYSQSTCGMCKTIHLLLDKNNIEYEEIQDVNLMKEKGVLHTPTLETEEGKLLQGKDIIDFIKGI